MENQKYGKLVNGELKYAPYPLEDKETKIYTDDAEEYLKYGYKTIVNTPAPTTDKVVYTSSWTEDTTTITKVWSENLQGTIENKISELESYDNSSDVNEFFINGTGLWKNRDDRTALERAIEKWEAKGNTTYTLCDDNLGEVTLPNDTIRSMLSEIECYAIQCMQVTFEHKQAIKALTSVAEVIAYNFKTNYPSKLSF